MYPACNHWFPGPLAPSETNKMGKLLHQKLAQEVVVQLEFQDLHNKFKALKKGVSQVFRKYNSNFWKVEASDSLNCQDFVAHKAAINLINKWCTCGKSDNEGESLEYETPISSPSPVGGPMVPEAMPLAVMPQFQVRGIVMPSFGKADDSCQGHSALVPAQ